MEHTIRIGLNRDSVHAGDDVHSHVAQWDAPSEITVAEVIYEVARSYIANVVGAVSWVLQGYQPPAEGGRGIAQRWEDLAVVFCDHSKPLDERLIAVAAIAYEHGDVFAQPVRSLPVFAEVDEFHFYLRYVPGGRLRPWAEFCSRYQLPRTSPR
ncbi:hypothetical protein [Nocardia concava]|uniref:hypothetical protein n=1 Tax=Nocardia concava TaxID=257281 RepID=UPI0002E2881E|nr:hypothetical protein [Nocardia concava]